MLENAIRAVEKSMRPVPALAALALCLMIADTGIAQRADDQIAPRSVALQKQGEAALAAGDPVAAEDALEAAVVADPRNRAAFVALGHVAQAQQLPGKAIRYYKDALLLDPNDVVALGGEGSALVQRGAVDRAKANLARIQTLCKTNCAAATTLAADIAKGPPPAAVQTAQVSDKVPPKGAETSATQTEKP
jgi:Tfp pilus assembly protein PilF